MRQQSDETEDETGQPRLRSDAFLKDAMERWGDSVYRVALAQTGSPSDADDVYQDVFLRLLENNTSFASDEHLKAWLIRVAINRCHDLERTAWRRRTEPLENERIGPETPEAFQSDIWEVVGALPQDRRIAIHLHYVEGYSTEEIARIVQCKPSTVRTRLHRAREQIRKQLESDAADDDQRKEQPHEREPQQAGPGRLSLDDVPHACAQSPAG